MSLLAVGLMGSAEARQKKPNAVDKALEKFASGMLYANPTLRNGERKRVARQRLLKEFKRQKVDAVSAAELKRIRRKVADWDDEDWVELMGKCALAKLENKKAHYLLSKAEKKKFNRLEQYLAQRLLEGYFEDEIASREREAKAQLRAVGKAYSAFLKQRKRLPQGFVEMFSSDEVSILNPLTNTLEPLIYVGAGPEWIKGSNHYKVVAYTTFAVGKGLKSRWVVYKGGRVAEWKTDALLKKHRALEKKNRAARRVLVLEQKQRDEGKKQPSQETSNAEISKPSNLRITIKEIW